MKVRGFHSETWKGFFSTPPFRANEVLEDEHLWALKSRMILPVSISSSLLDKCVFVSLRVGVGALATEDSKGGGSSCVFEPWFLPVAGWSKKNIIRCVGQEISLSFIVWLCVKKKNPRFLRKGIDWLSSQFHWGCGFQLKAEVSPELHTNYRASCRSGFYPAPVCLCVFLNCIRPSNFPNVKINFRCISISASLLHR